MYVYVCSLFAHRQRVIQLLPFIGDGPVSAHIGELQLLQGPAAAAAAAAAGRHAFKQTQRMWAAALGKGAVAPPLPTLLPPAILLRQEKKPRGSHTHYTHGRRPHSGGSGDTIC